MSTNRKRLRIAGAAVAAAALATTLAACGGDDLDKDKDSGSGSGGKSLVVGSAGFTESQIMAELYSQLLSDAGYSTSIKKVDNRELYEPALEKGQIDVVPEYAATLAEWLNAKVNGPKAPDEKPVASSDVDKTVTALKQLAEPRGLKVLAAGDAVDQNAFAVTKKFAEEHNLKTLSDLGKSGVAVKLAAGEECSTRPFCKPGLEKTYGIKVTSVDPKGVGTPVAKKAVQDGTDQLVLTTTTDGILTPFDLVLLEDDKNLQNADNLLPVVNAKDAGDSKITDILDKLTRVLTTEDLVALNGKVDGERAKPADVAKDYLTEKGLLKS